MRHLITPMDLTVEETLDILDLAERIRSNPVLYRHVADGRQLATLFMSQAPEHACHLSLPC